MLAWQTSLATVSDELHSSPAGHPEAIQMSEKPPIHESDLVGYSGSIEESLTLPLGTD